MGNSENDFDKAYKNRVTGEDIDQVISIKKYFNQREVKTSEKDLAIRLLNRHEVDTLANLLIELIKMSSPAYEHVDMKRIVQIDLGLKLAEAEATLAYYQASIGEPSSSCP
jgi:hypothetical protein